MPNAAGVALEAAAPATNPRRKQLHLGTSAAAPADGASATAPSRSSGSSRAPTESLAQWLAKSTYIIWHTMT